VQSTYSRDGLEVPRVHFYEGMSKRKDMTKDEVLSKSRTSFKTYFFPVN
jgi:hypothetical protein